MLTAFTKVAHGNGVLNLEDYHAKVGNIRTVDRQKQDTAVASSSSVPAAAAVPASVFLVQQPDTYLDLSKMVAESKDKFRLGQQHGPRSSGQHLEPRDKNGDVVPAHYMKLPHDGPVCRPPTNFQLPRS